jgi:phytoene synthase
MDAMDETLAGSYAYCRELHRIHGRTYYLATRLLPAWKRRYVHALYGFMRYTDDIVDHVDRTRVGDPAALLHAWSVHVLAALDGGPVEHRLLPALLDTAGRFALDRGDIEAFLRSMAMDLTVTEYETYDDLLEYMAGSAAAIGSLMLPILGAADLGAAREPARQLGLAFQLTNFIRDVGEDLDRGRIYLPLKDLAEFGVTPRDLNAKYASGTVRDLIAYEVDRARGHYRRAAPGIPMLDPSSQPAIRAAFHAYGAILDEVVAARYDVFARRAVVPASRKLAIVMAALLTPAGRPIRRLPGGTGR